tara:strand:+ start:1161 stop:1319 length:159 start_codon:yes stop_codon:yes gene_type:complete
MTKQKRPTYSAEFKLEAAQLVVECDHFVQEAAELMSVSKSEWMPNIRLYIFS